METKLKALKVADLKEILTTVSIPTTARATKADLISKLLASDAAQAEYQRKYEPDAAPKPVPAVISKDSLLEPPLDDEIAWSDPEDEPVKAVPAAVPTVVAPPSAKPPSAVKLTSTPLAETAPVLEPSAPADLDAAVNEPEAAKLSARAERFGLPDEVEMRKARAERFGVPVSNDANVPATPLTEEQERALAERKARAERFGIPLIDPQTVTPDQSRGRGRRSRPKQPVDSTGTTTEVPVKINARAQRPATGAGKPQSTSAAKRKAAQESVDPEEAERRRKRAERFGTGAKP